MPKTIFAVPTWSHSCGYKQDFEPTQENMNKHLNMNPKFPVDDLLAGECPKCRQLGKVAQLSLETDIAQMTRITVMGEEEIDNLEVFVAFDASNKHLTRKLTDVEKKEQIQRIQDSIAEFSKIGKIVK